MVVDNERRLWYEWQQAQQVLFILRRAGVLVAVLESFYSRIGRRTYEIHQGHTMPFAGFAVAQKIQVAATG